MTDNQSVILIVDDSEDNRDLLARYVHRQGHLVETASNGYEALQILQTQPCDLVLLDIMMPEMNGYQVLEHVKINAALRHIPVIVISAIGELESTVKCIELGAEDYLPKPFNPVLLKARISACLEKKRLHDQEQAYLEELLTIQNIDRELNTGLDVRHAMQTTLAWAIRRTAADAGLIGVVTNGDFDIVASHGYDSTLSEHELQGYLLDSSAIRDALTTRQTQRQDVETLGSHGSLLPTTQCQLIVPIQREAQVIGLLLLESATVRQCTDQMLVFLSRLSDHAAIAIANAQLYAAVQKANLAKSEFVAFASHELKTPMTAIKGYTDILIKSVAGPVSEFQVNILQNIRANVDLMTTLVSDLADVSRIETGHLSLEQNTIFLEEVVEAALRTTRGQIEAKQHTLIVTIPSDLPPVCGDLTRLGQIMTNLISNAYKYTPVGGHIHIDAELATEPCNADDSSTVVRVAVKDNGIGIELEDQPKIFGKFFRSGDLATTDVSGTGLGLHITKHLVEMHSGRIWFTSVPQQGSTFYFTLPVAETNQQLDAKSV